MRAPSDMRSRSRCQVARERLHVGVVEVKHRVCHGRDAGADALAGLVLAQRFQKNIFALAGQSRRGTEAIVVLGMT